MIEVWFHGSCEPINPGGSMACSFIVKMDGVERKRYTEFWTPASWNQGNKWNPVQTSANVASYQTLVSALGYLFISQLHLEETVIRGNSKMVINQMFEDWKINAGHYASLALSCRDILKRWPKVRGELIPWKQNDAASLSRETYLKNGVQPTDWSKKGEADAARNHRARR